MKHSKASEKYPPLQSPHYASEYRKLYQEAAKDSAEFGMFTLATGSLAVFCAVEIPSEGSGMVFLTAASGIVALIMAETTKGYFDIAKDHLAALNRLGIQPVEEQHEISPQKHQ